MQLDGEFLGEVGVFEDDDALDEAVDQVHHEVSAVLLSGQSTATR